MPSYFYCKYAMDAEALNLKFTYIHAWMQVYNTLLYLLLFRLGFQKFVALSTWVAILNSIPE